MYLKSRLKLKIKSWICSDYMPRSIILHGQHAPMVKGADVSKMDCVTFIRNWDDAMMVVGDLKERVSLFYIEKLIESVEQALFGKGQFFDFEIGRFLFSAHKSGSCSYHFRFKDVKENYLEFNISFVQLRELYLWLLCAKRKIKNFHKKEI